jgi:hypothetical protein
VKLVLGSTSGACRPGLQVWLDEREGEARDRAPIDLRGYAEFAEDRIRKHYPSFTYRLAKESGLLDLPGWEGVVGAYWLVPFSEKSPMRTALIEHLYRLGLVEAAILEHRPQVLEVGTDDDCLFRALERLGELHGVPVVRLTGRKARGPRDPRFKLARRLAANALHLFRNRVVMLLDYVQKRRLLRGQAEEVMADRVSTRGRPVVFYTRYPVLWELSSTGDPSERNFGTFPAFLARHGYDVVYAAVLSVPAASLRSGLADTRRRARELGIVFLESLLSARELLRVHADFSHVWRYLRWRRHQSGRPICFDGLDVRELALRELDRDFVYDSEILRNRLTAYGFRRFGRAYRPAVVYHPFEYQPMERAVFAGVKTGWPDTVVVGQQTGTFSSNRPGFFYADGEVTMPGALPASSRAPLPDYLVTYGTLSHAVLSRQCPSERVLLPGAIRFPHIQQVQRNGGPPEGPADPQSGTQVLVGGTIDPDETRQLLQAAIEMAASWPEMRLLIKFHHHNLMRAEWDRMAKRAGFTRYEVFDTDLLSLLRTARAALVGATTSLVVEAIALGCMPVVLQRHDRFSYGSVTDMREAVYLCEDVPAMTDALRECVAQEPGYWNRRRSWPGVLEKMLLTLDGKQNERLFQQLSCRGVL